VTHNMNSLLTVSSISEHFYKMGLSLFKASKFIPSAKVSIDILLIPKQLRLTSSAILILKS